MNQLRPNPAPLPPGPPTSRMVLLVDSVNDRQGARAARLRSLGATVHCASNGTDARALWRPAVYALVLIEFRDADDDIDPFYWYAVGLSAAQRFGFYSATAPYIATRVAEAARDRTASHRPKDRIRELSQNPAGRRAGGDLFEAVHRIAALRRFRRPAERELDVPRREEPAGLPKPSFLSAVERAERALGGDA